jgi:hypothetical protein
VARRTYRGELAGEVSWLWLVSVTWAGQTHRYSSRPVAVIDAGGTSYLYAGGLDDIDADAGLGAIGGSSDGIAIGVALRWAGARSVAQMIEDGHDLADASAEVALWVEGTPLESRWVVATGDCWQPTYGDADEPVSFTVRSMPLDDRTVIPPPAAIVSSDTWATARSTYVGRSYPVPYGTPGVWITSETVSTSVPATPALVVEEAVAGTADTLLIADGPVEANTVTVWADGVSCGSLSVAQQFDGLGRLTSVVDVTGLTAAQRQAGEYHVSWTGGAASTTAGTGLGDVILWLLRQAGSLAVDYGRWETAAAALNAVSVGGCIERATPITSYVVDTLLELAPVSLVVGGEGIYPAWWALDPRGSEAVAALEAGRNASRETMVQYERDRTARASVVRARYAYDLAEGAYRGALTIVPVEQWDGSTVDVVPDAYLEAGGVDTEVQSGDLLWSRDSAALASQWRARGYGAIPRSVTYRVPQEHGAWLEVGDVVTITDDDLAWSARPAIVTRVALDTDGAVSVELLIWRRGA